jgi:hypothetical protein
MGLINVVDCCRHVLHILDMQLAYSLWLASFMYTNLSMCLQRHSSWDSSPINYPLCLQCVLNLSTFYWTCFVYTSFLFHSCMYTYTFAFVWQTACSTLGFNICQYWKPASENSACTCTLYTAIPIICTDCTMESIQKLFAFAQVVTGDSSASGSDAGGSKADLESV